MRHFITKIMLLASISTFFSANSLAAEIKPILIKQLSELNKEQEFSIVTIAYEPGEASPAHRHYAHTFVYVISGSIVMQVEGGEEVIVKAGETFYETPDDIHIVSGNASETEPASFLVMYLKPPGVSSVLVE